MHECPLSPPCIHTCTDPQSLCCGREWAEVGGGLETRDAWLPPQLGLCCFPGVSEPVSKAGPSCMSSQSRSCLYPPKTGTWTYCEESHKPLWGCAETYGTPTGKWQHFPPQIWGPPSYISNSLKAMVFQSLTARPQCPVPDIVWALFWNQMRNCASPPLWERRWVIVSFGAFFFFYFKKKMVRKYLLNWVIIPIKCFLKLGIKQDEWLIKVKHIILSLGNFQL